MKLRTALLLLFCFISSHSLAGEPALPAGLDSGKNPGEPGLPAGLGTVAGESAEPQLPSGLNTPMPEQPAFLSEASDNIDWLSGFWELRVGRRLGSDPHQQQTSIAESRLQLEFEKSLHGISLNLTTDLLLDQVADSQRIDLENGDGWLDLRVASLAFSPADFIDLRIGRQILTWGTGDLLFINDLFPKDWNAFFIGRDEEYLKAPSDAIKASLFTELINLNLIYTPTFDADRFIDGRRISFFSPDLGEIAGRNAITRIDRPYDDELALRLYRHFNAVEAAVYFYQGRWKSPAGLNPSNGLALFPRLRTLGASLRGPLFSGIANMEIGYYDSREDRRGDNALINNSEIRLLLGYEQELARNLTLGTQYYLEQMQDHDAYLRSLPTASAARDEDRHLLTARLSLLTHQQNTRWSLFVYYSISENDLYLRPKVAHKWDDNWSLEAGANLFAGEDQHSFFAQFRDNTNAYVSLRYGF